MDIENNVISKKQLSLFAKPNIAIKSDSTIKKLVEILNNNLDFHDQTSNYASHNLHSFPAKFPPQLPAIFINSLTKPGEIVLDPMVGSGTTIVEALFADRVGIGFDIDPLALKISRVKTTRLDKEELTKLSSKIYSAAKSEFHKNPKKLQRLANEYFDAKTKKFINFWFLPETQLELMALLIQINSIEKAAYRNFFQIIFSSLIITKSGGVSLALDLGHTRPHKVKALFDQAGTIVYGDKNIDPSKKHFSAKLIRSSFDEFRKRARQNIASVIDMPLRYAPVITFCDAQELCLKENSVDLVITSPPYASNAIDYMRAHKFSLAWFGAKIDTLTTKRNTYIGAEATSGFKFEDLPVFTSNKIARLSEIDPKKALVLKRYFSEMKRSLKEIFRVLKPGRVAVMVVGSSLMKGIDTETHKCLQEIGISVGFISPHIGIRQLDRNRRMLPASNKVNSDSQIQKRMHQEYIVGFYKP